MKILVFSDSHGKLSEMNEVIQKESDASYILFAGDYKGDIYKAQTNGIPFSAVAGNCDTNSLGYSSDETEEVITLCKTRILLTHGHIYNVKNTLDTLAAHCLSMGVDICVYGHTHIPDKQNIGGVLFVNPGSISSHRSAFEPSYALIDLDEDAEIKHVWIKLV